MNEHRAERKEHRVEEESSMRTQFAMPFALCAKLLLIGGKVC